MYGVKTTAYKVDGQPKFARKVTILVDRATVTQAEKVQKAISEVVKDFGTIDIFVANAGMKLSTSFYG